MSRDAPLEGFVSYRDSKVVVSVSRPFSVKCYHDRFKYPHALVVVMQSDRTPDRPTVMGDIFVVGSITSEHISFIGQCMVLYDNEDEPLYGLESMHWMSWPIVNVERCLLRGLGVEEQDCGNQFMTCEVYHQFSELGYNTAKSILQEINELLRLTKVICGEDDE